MNKVVSIAIGDKYKPVNECVGVGAHGVCVCVCVHKRMCVSLI